MYCTVPGRRVSNEQTVIIALIVTQLSWNAQQKEGEAAVPPRAGLVLGTGGILYEKPRPAWPFPFLPSSSFSFYLSPHVKAATHSLDDVQFPPRCFGPAESWSIHSLKTSSLLSRDCSLHSNHSFLDPLHNPRPRLRLHTFLRLSVVPNH